MKASSSWRVLTGIGLVVVLGLGGCAFDASFQGPGPDGGPADQLPGRDRPQDVPDVAQDLDSADEGDLQVPVDAPDGEDQPPSCQGTPVSCGTTTCVDCTASTRGSACLGGVCGCRAATDCPTGMACDPDTGTCGTSCAGKGGPLACNGGCCDGTTCLGTTAQSDTVCGNTGGLCASCANNSTGVLCIKLKTAAEAGGFCGCASGANCPAGGASCIDNLCDTRCDASTPCAGGCCQGDRCQPGNVDQTCGASGACTDCSASGLTCLPGRTCGCTTEAQCPTGMACNTSTGVCSAACGGGSDSPCNGGCCDGNNTCQTGNTAAACGPIGGTCSTCVTVCLAGGVCGCDAASDCPSGQSCNTGTGLCQTSCGAGHTACNGGCCSGGTCVVGTANNACGNTGNNCVSCTSAANGHLCLAGACGCSDEGDCGAVRTCQTGGARGLCVTGCGNPNQSPCSTGCCSSGNSCVAGTSNGACGDDGLDCLACAGTTPACIVGDHCGCADEDDCPSGQACDHTTGTCSTTCGTGNRSICNGGCCSNNICIVGTANNACGNNGQGCRNCTGGTQCNSGQCN